MTGILISTVPRLVAPSILFVCSMRLVVPCIDKEYRKAYRGAGTESGWAGHVSCI